MNSHRNVTIQVLVLLALLSCNWCQHSAQVRPQKIRSIISNALFHNQQIMIGINIFNSTHPIYSNHHITKYSSEILEMTIPVSVQIFQSMDNLTMKVTFSYKDTYSLQFIQSWRGYASTFFQNTLDLTKFKKISKINSEQFFASGQVGSSSTNTQKGNFTLHIAEDFNIMILHSQMTLPGSQTDLLKKLNFTYTEFEFNGVYNQAKYFPSLDISQMHIPYKYYKPIKGLLQQNEANITSQENNQPQRKDFSSVDIKNHTIKLHIYPYDLMRYAVFFQMFDPSARQQAMKINPLMQYMMDQQAYDDMKELLFTNNLYIVAITILMTFAKMVLQIFALKNEFKVWNQIQKNKGLSIKVLYTDLAFQVVFFLYLVDNESNLMMTVPMGINILVVLWKIKKTVFIEKITCFPFIKPRHYDWCKKHQKIDSQGVTYMYYGLIVLFGGYLGYEMLVSQSLSKIFSYSGMLQKMVFFMGMAGFIRMTPQLYINYKLKSVDHLPWRTLIYRFIETIIDDFYVFLVTTPLLHKIMVFRQDVIFLLYLYQRFIYKTDPNRIGTAGGMVLQRQQVEQVQQSLNIQKSGKSQ